jgi:hypothetical protein
MHSRDDWLCSQFLNWLVERQITCVDHACLSRITPSQLNNPAQGFDPVQFFLKYWNHGVLHEHQSTHEVNQETNQFHGGSLLKEIVLHPDLCSYPKKTVEAHQAIVPGRGPAKQPNCHDVSSVECESEQIDWALGQDMLTIVERISDPDVHNGGPPFHPVTYDLELNDFDDRQICHLPIKEDNNSIVIDASEVEKLKLCDLFISYIHLSYTGFWCTHTTPCSLI